MSAESLSETEVETLRKGATGAGLLVTMSDRSFFDTFKEAGAMAKHLAAAKGGSESPLMRRLAEGRGTGFGVTTSPGEVETRTLEALRWSAELLRSKAPDQLESYRSFVLDLVRSVSSAADGGEEAEAAAIAKVQAGARRTLEPALQAEEAEEPAADRDHQGAHPPRSVWEKPTP